MAPHAAIDPRKDAPPVVRHAAQPTFAAALLDPALPCPPGLTAWNGSDPAARFVVYRNNVIVSLVDALADTYPVVRQLVGDEFFRAMAAVFARASPPRSPVLAHYGEGFAAFIAGFDPARSLPYLADLAALEYAYVQAFHAADAEVLQRGDGGAAAAFGALVGERVGAIRLALHPSVRLLHSAHAVVSLWAAHQHDDAPAVEAALASVDVHTPEAALLVRDGLQVQVLRLTPGAHAFAAAAMRGARLADAADAAAAADPAFDLAACLALLLEHCAITALRLPGAADLEPTP